MSRFWCLMSVTVCVLFFSCKKNTSEAFVDPKKLPVQQEQQVQFQEDLPYKLAWSDEFTADGLPDSTKWGYDVGANGWGNNELEYYTKARPENALVSNGKLIIEARKEVYEGKAYYTSARLLTKNKAQWTYGKFEIKAKIPKGIGTWPTIWLISANDPIQWPEDGELDIMEAVGYEPNVIHGVAHNYLYNGGNNLFKSGHVLIPDAQDSFHVYSMEWTDKKISWYVDDNLYFSYVDPGLGSNGWPYNNMFYMILNIAVGGNYGGVKGVDDTIFPQQMVVDYVRIYQRIR